MEKMEGGWRAIHNGTRLPVGVTMPSSTVAHRLVLRAVHAGISRADDPHRDGSKLRGRPSAVVAARFSCNAHDGCVVDALDRQRKFVVDQGEERGKARLCDPVRIKIASKSSKFGPETAIAKSLHAETVDTAKGAAPSPRLAPGEGVGPVLPTESKCC
jgi:hypothetical protein